MKFLIILFFISIGTLPSKAQLLGLGTFEDKNNTYKKVADLIQNNNCDDIWELCSKDFKRLYKKSSLCDSVDKINKLFNNVSNNRTNKVKSGSKIGVSYYADYSLLPRNWFGSLIPAFYSDKIERKLHLKFIKESDGFYLDSIGITDNYLENDFTVKEYIKTTLESTDSLLFYFWFPTVNYKSEKIYNDTSYVYKRFTNEINKFFSNNKIEYIDSYPFFPDINLKICLSYNNKDIKNKNQSYLKTKASEVYIPELELIFTIFDKSDVVFISNGHSFASYKVQDLPLLKGFIIKELDLKLK